MLFGIDVSSYQGKSIDWAKVAAAGNRFAIVKVSEGDSLVDPARMVDISGAKAAGLYTGIYHFAHPALGDGRNQAQRLFDNCGGAMPDLPPALDLESRGIASPTATLMFVRDFIQGCEDLFGKKPIIYTGKWFFETLDASGAMDLSDCPLWMAEYSHGGTWTPSPKDHPSLLKPWGAEWTLWQFSGSASVAGIPGNCDRDCFNGDEDLFRALCGFPVAPDAA